MDRNYNRYWMMRPSGGWAEETVLLIECREEQECRWVQIYIESELQALISSLEPKVNSAVVNVQKPEAKLFSVQGIRELALRTALLKHMPSITAGLQRIARLNESAETGYSNRKVEKDRKRYLRYKNPW